MCIGEGDQPGEEARLPPVVVLQQADIGLGHRGEDEVEGARGAEIFFVLAHRDARIAGLGGEFRREKIGRIVIVQLADPVGEGLGQQALERA